MSDTGLVSAVEAIKRRLVSCGLPGLAIGITDRERNRNVILHGVESLRTRKPLTPQSKFAIGSVSKSFTAVALMQLMSEGRFDPHAPLSDYLPSLAAYTSFASITAHHLLTHTSGLPNYLMHAASSRYVIAALEDFRPAWVPGTDFWYSNTGYQLLGYILENIERLSYPAILQRRIFNPLNMRSTIGVIEDVERQNMATSYVRWPYDGAHVEAPWFEYVAADGGLISTVPDLCAFARFLLNRGGTPGGRVLSEDGFVALTTPALCEYGYGLYIRSEEGRSTYSHGGGISGFGCTLYVYPDDGFAVALMQNGPREEGLARWIIDAVGAAFREECLPDSPPLAKDEVVDLEKYANSYRRTSDQSVGETLHFAVDGDRLWLGKGEDRLPMHRFGHDCFRLSGHHASNLPFFFGRADKESGAPVVEVSHGERWYINDSFEGQREPHTPEEYSGYVGHFESNGPEGPVARNFVRNGRLWTVLSPFSDFTPVLLESFADGLFRYASAKHSPEWVKFDTVVDGAAQRMTFSGAPMYRKDTP